MAQTVQNGTYDATTSANTTALANIVRSDLKDTSKWNVDGSTPGQIKITYTDSKIDKDSIEAGTPSEEGRVVSLITLKKQDATVAFDAWIYNHTDQTVTKGDLVLKIGDYVNDTGAQTVTDFDGSWRVLGSEDGQLLLVTATYYAPFTANAGLGIESSDKLQCGPNAFGLKLQGLDGWENGLKKLDGIGATYNNSKLEKGRSITVDDINKITGYNPNNTGVNDPNQTGTGTPFRNNQINQYKNKITYTLKDDGYVWYKGDQAVTTETKSTYQKFWLPGTESNITSPYTVTSTAYMYYPTTLTESQNNSASVGIANTSAAYDMLFKTPYAPYWLASPCVSASVGDVGWYFFYVPSGLVMLNFLWASGSGSNSSLNYGVRPAVSLKSNITPTFVSTDSSTGISAYQI